MIVLAIDPGTTHSAAVVWDGISIIDMQLVENHEMLMWMDKTGADILAIEMIASYGMAVGKSVFETCVWIGRFIETFDGPFEYVYRKDVKMHLCHTMKAKDANISRALKDRFGEPGTKKEPGMTYGVKKDIWSALAVGVTWLDQHKEKTTAVEDEYRIKFGEEIVNHV